MPQHALHQCFQREIRSLRRELDAYPDDASVWASPPGIKNSAGTLFLHLAGGLQHFIGAKLGATGYVRDRDAEFAKRGASRAEIARELDAAAAAVDAGFSKASDTVLGAPFPQQMDGNTFVTLDWLTHLLAHLGYHLGQIDYHRRIVTGDSTTVETVSGMELAAALARTS
jgi:uncharacterized damage-inducible protein DinB